VALALRPVLRVVQRVVTRHLLDGAGLAADEGRAASSRWSSAWAPTMDRLLAAVDDDVPPKRNAMARRSLQAHLLKLRDDGLITESMPRHRTPDTGHAARP